MGDKGLDVVGQAVQPVPLPEQEVSCRAARVASYWCGRCCQNKKTLPNHKIHYFWSGFQKNHYEFVETPCDPTSIRLPSAIAMLSANQTSSSSS